MRQKAFLENYTPNTSDFQFINAEAGPYNSQIKFVGPNVGGAISSATVH